MREHLQDGGGPVLSKEQQDWVARKWVRILLYSMGDVMKDCNVASGMGCWDRFESYRRGRTIGHGIGQDISISTLLALLTF